MEQTFFAKIMIGIGITIAVMCGLLVIATLGMFIYRIFGYCAHYWVEFRTKVLHYRLDIKAKTNLMHTRNLKEVFPDVNGRMPLLFDGKNIRDTNSGRLYTMHQTLETIPDLEQIDARIRALVAMAQGHVSARTQQLIMEPQEQELPQIIIPSSNLNTLMDKHGFSPRLHNTLIGETVNESTQSIVPLTIDIPKNIHQLVCGSSGMGKSTLLEAMALQLAQCPDVQLCAVDYGSGSFDRLEPHMRYPIADTPSMAIALFQELIRVCNERKELYKQYNRIRSLEQYNAQTGQNLPFISCFVDETSALLEYAGTKSALVELARLGRKHGIGLTLASTSMKATELPTEARGNCQARIAFWLEPGLSRSLLNSDIASTLGGIGDIVVMKPGQVGHVIGKSPMVTDQDYLSLQEPRTQQTILEPIQTIETIEELDNESLPKDERVRALHAQGYSNTAIARQVFKHGNGTYIAKVKDILAD